MRNKVLIILVTGFLLQVIISCCDCGDPHTYENIYTGVTVIPYDNSGFYPEIVVDTVYKNAFGLGVQVDFESRQYANHINLGFTSAMAFQCDCIEPDYLYSDPINHMEIFMIIPNSQVETNVTDLFQIYNYTNELISLDDFFAQREEWHDGFQIELVKYESIPKSVIFKVEVFLESGNSYLDQTNILNFYQ
ncbi:hypothetical protein [Saccharicrinis fermentans]|uniref:DUF5034 domain-containing protein n=1 Tax=Saccharicrinis fermentans DSM 9555 = JCM 21142 TaxID=869213 RepID=W7Y2T7_9BACT|nr:hypothetical protein [Saccharicrinis fermentans]GAF05135.1 hypothetical protein JCM21142_93859 [Saccharicrinis fermentans DSM 9555 = JCM 21142]